MIPLTLARKFALACDIMGLIAMHLILQIGIELRDAYHLTNLEDIRVIRDRQTSEWQRIPFF